MDTSFRGWASTLARAFLPVNCLLTWVYLRTTLSFWGSNQSSDHESDLFGANFDPAPIVSNWSAQQGYEEQHEPGDGPDNCVLCNAPELPMHFWHCSYWLNTSPASLYSASGPYLVHYWQQHRRSLQLLRLLLRDDRFPRRRSIGSIQERFDWAIE